MDSTLAVQQFIQQLIKRDPSNIDLILTMPDAQDEGVWKYEHLRWVENADFVQNEICIQWRRRISYVADQWLLL